MEGGFALVLCQGIRGSKYRNYTGGWRLRMVLCNLWTFLNSLFLYCGTQKNLAISPWLDTFFFCFVTGSASRKCHRMILHFFMCRTARATWSRMVVSHPSPPATPPHSHQHSLNVYFFPISSFRHFHAIQIYPWKFAA